MSSLQTESLSAAFLPQTPGRREKSGLVYHESQSSLDNLNPEISPFILTSFCSRTMHCSHFSCSINALCGYDIATISLVGLAGLTYSSFSQRTFQYVSSILSFTSSSSYRIPVVRTVKINASNCLWLAESAVSAQHYTVYLNFLLMVSIFLSGVSKFFNISVLL